MSAEENETRVRRIYEELRDGRKLDIAHELIAEGAVNYDTGLTARPFGPGEMGLTVGMITAAFPDNRHKVEEVLADGDTVVLRCTLTGTHRGEFMGIPPRGRRTGVKEIHIYRMREGKAVEHRVGRDDAGAMRQLGFIADAFTSPGTERRVGRL